MGWINGAVEAVRTALSGPATRRADRGFVLELDASPAHTFDSAPKPVDRVLSEMRASTTVTRDFALQVPAVQRGRNELCAIATIPMVLYRGVERIDNAMFRQFDVDVPNVVHMAMTVEDLAFVRIAWWRVMGRDFEGFPIAVRRIDPDRVTLHPPSGYRLVPGDPRKYVWITADTDAGGKGYEQVPASDMIRFDSPNPGILKANARAVRIAYKLDSLTEMYADNPNLREYFTDNDAYDGDLFDDDEVDEFLAEYGAMRGVRPFGYIPSQLKRSDVSVPSPKDMTLADLRESVNLAIANGLGIDPEDLGVSTTSRTYQNAVDRKQDKINRVYQAYMSAITDRLAMGDVTRRGQIPRFDLTDYLKSDPVTQAGYWKALLDMGVVDAQWIGEQASIPPEVIARAGAAPRPAPAAAGTDGATLSRRLVPVKFDGAGPAFTFAGSDFDGAAPAAPAVDAKTRTITGLAVPYGAIANKYGIKIRFMPGSLEYSDPARMPHLKDHATPVGFHRKITQTDAGPMVELAVLDAPEGSPAKTERDQLLYDAEHGLYSGLSIGTDFSFDPEDGDVQYNEDDDVYEVVRASWRETTTTYMPAFTDARVTKVAASLTGGSMHCQYCGGAHAPGIACATFARQIAPVQPTAPAPAPGPGAAPSPATAPVPAPGGPAAAPSFEQFSAWLAASQQGVKPTNGPTLVNPNPGVVEVNEPLPYRFDRKGNLRPGTHDFSADLAAGWNPNGFDQAARDRAEGWLKRCFEAKEFGAGLSDIDHQFAITPANVTALNYPQNKPEMYVDQLEYQYPLWDAVNKGTLATQTPFLLPKFNSSSGLVGDHVSGTEPTPGAFTATSQTITPSALSGKVEILRETWDQGGNPQASGLIWRQMIRAYYEGLEAWVVAQIVAAAASIPDITITTAAVDSALDQAIADGLVPLQYIRGGDRFQTVFTQIDLYKAMIKAKDTAGRRLYPTLNPQNAVGQAVRGYTAIDAHGKMWLPAWALAASGTVVASSYMFDPDAVNAWASAPQRIDLQWRVAWVDVGVWGYKAFAITDFTRTRELLYDPV